MSVIHSTSICRASKSVEGVNPKFIGYIPSIKAIPCTLEKKTKNQIQTLSVNQTPVHMLVQAISKTAAPCPYKYPHPTQARPIPNQPPNEYPTLKKPSDTIPVTRRSQALSLVVARTRSSAVCRCSTALKADTDAVIRRLPMLYRNEG